MRYAWVIAVLSLPACASAPPMWTPAARTTAASCAAPAPSAAASWQLVAARGFTFCVPTDWEATGARSWRTAGGTMHWGTGTPARHPVVSGVIEMRVPAGGPPPSSAELEDAARAQVAQRCSNRRFSESVGGRPAALFDTECDGVHYTGSQWTAPAVYFQGEAENDATAVVELQVYRSARFVADSAR